MKESRLTLHLKKQTDLLIFGPRQVVSIMKHQKRLFLKSRRMQDVIHSTFFISNKPSRAVKLGRKVFVMREILFRGKNEYTGWIYGDLRNYENGGAKAIFSHELLHRIEVIPETVGQFTGLTDYNGRKIFEADIVKIQIGNIIKYGAVFYGERAARIGIKDSTGEANFSFMQQPLIKQYQIIVIGNIFDNPELLKEGEAE